MEEITKILQEINNTQTAFAIIIILVLIGKFLIWFIDMLEQDQEKTKKRKKEEKEEIKREIIEYYDKTNEKEK